VWHEPGGRTGVAISLGMAIRSQAWPGIGGQEGSETSGVSPNNNPRHERPASSSSHIKHGSGLVPATGLQCRPEEDEIVQASWKREGP
jgi:hypothetical protein